MSGDKKREAPRAERVLPGVWRLRLPLPWPGVPHGNAWAVASDGGIVLFDTGIGGRDRLRQFDLALAQAGFGLEDIRLLVCTHSHTDHYGLAAPITERAGCELWMHPAWEHVRLLADDPAAALEQRLEVARQSGVPPASLERYRESRSDDEETGIDAIKVPDRDLFPGVEVETDLGAWQVYETPGHAPSHVVLHQPERRLMISGDHLLGRTVLFFDHGHTPDPVGEFLRSLDEVEPLEVDLCLPGHGRPFRDPEAKIAEARRQVDELLGKVREALAAGDKTAFEIVGEIIGSENLNSPVSAWVLQIVLSCLDHLAILGEVATVEGTDPQRWSWSIASHADGELHFRARGCGSSGDRLRRAGRPSGLRRDHADAQGRAGAGGRSGAQRGRRDPGPALGRAAAARGGASPTSRQAASPTSCSPGRRCATTSGRSSWSAGGRGHQGHLRGPHHTRPCRSAAAAVVAVVEAGDQAAPERHCRRVRAPRRLPAESAA